MNLRDEIKRWGKFAIHNSFKIGERELVQSGVLFKFKIEGEGGGPSYLKRTTDSKFPQTFDFSPNAVFF